MDFSRPFHVAHQVWWEGAFYTEGPVVDGEGNCYFTTLTGRAIMRGKVAGEVSHWISSTCPNGQSILPCGDLLVCDSGEAALKRFDRAGRLLRDEVKGLCAGEEVLVPNDVVVDSEGGFYFTDSIRHEGKVFHKGADGRERLLARGLDYPNGLVLSAQSDCLFVAESYKNRVLSISLGLSDQGICSVFAELPKHASGRDEDNLPDGMAADPAGNLWVAHYGMGSLQVLNRQGKLMATIPTGIPLTSNLCFVGFDPLKVIATGGFGEPGPGRVVLIEIDQWET